LFSQADGEAGLAHPAWTEDGNQPRRLIAEEGAKRGQIGCAADKGRGLMWQVAMALRRCGW
jgi:hypothetical protein